MSQPLRIGVMGAARIASKALLRPAQLQSAAAVVAIAARDRARAAEMARQWSIPHVHADYESLISDPDIDAIYVALPNSLHAEWTLRAIAQGKHVLCEKPLATNASEAARVADAASAAGVVVMEAFHSLYHPLARVMRDLVQSGALGTITHVSARFYGRDHPVGDIRRSYDLGGGALMDLGCYCVRLLRWLHAGEPSVTNAQAELWSPGVDRMLRAELVWPDGCRGTVGCGFRPWRIPSARVHVRGTRGGMLVINPVMPHVAHLLVVRRGVRLSARMVRGRSTYSHQLEAFTDAVRTGGTVVSDARDAVGNMRVIDAIYQRSGLTLRGQVLTT
ncbi:MAG: Gfo/Idh/MocA family oxidoreductase [Vicinamibacterales bacterium]